MLLRLLVKMKLLVVRSLLCYIASSNVYSLTRMVGFPRSLVAAWMFNGPLKTLEDR